MENLDKILMFKNLRSIEEVNDVLFMIRELENHYIVKAYDTVRGEDKGLKALEKDFVEANLYTAKDFFNNSAYIGKSGFYKDMNRLEKYMNENIILVYKDEYNDLLYDQILGTFFVSPAIYPLEDFIPYENQNNNIRFKKGLNKK